MGQTPFPVSEGSQVTRLPVDMQRPVRLLNVALSQRFVSADDILEVMGGFDELFKKLPDPTALSTMFTQSLGIKAEFCDLFTAEEMIALLGRASKAGKIPADALLKFVPQKEQTALYKADAVIRILKERVLSPEGRALLLAPEVESRAKALLGGMANVLLKDENVSAMATPTLLLSSLGWGPFRRLEKFTSVLTDSIALRDNAENTFDARRFINQIPPREWTVNFTVEELLPILYVVSFLLPNESAATNSTALPKPIEPLPAPPADPPTVRPPPLEPAALLFGTVAPKPGVVTIPMPPAHDADAHEGPAVEIDIDPEPDHRDGEEGGRGEVSLDTLGRLVAP